jgi:3-phenylpropionate/trans-cinnamate dioxygenase ferredoxin reductase component
VTDKRSVVIVGAGLGGLRVAEELRRLGFDGRLTLIGDEPHAPYDRPPLSKEVLKGKKANPPSLLSDDALAALELELRTGVAATALDTVRQQITLSDGSEVGYDVLVIATGARARHWGMAAGATNVWPLRTAADAQGVASAIESKQRVAVLGAGFIGCEVAASAIEMGCPVTMIEMLPTPLGHIIGSYAGSEVARRHLEAGVDLRVETTIEDVVMRADKVTSIQLSDDTSIEIDVLVVGLGVLPNTEWLESSGVIIDNGVTCDAMGATSHANVYAIGDVARWVNLQSGRHARVEHWTTTTEHAAIVASQIADGPHERRKLNEVPYFWSDQYGTKIQCLGEPSASAQIDTLMTGPAGDRPMYLYSRGGLLTGVLGFGLPRAVMSLRQLVAKGAPVGEAVALVNSLHPATPVGA